MMQILFSDVFILFYLSILHNHGFDTGRSTASTQIILNCTSKSFIYARRIPVVFQVEYPVKLIDVERPRMRTAPMHGKESTFVWLFEIST
ncbi:hypothetical protein ABKN59_011434 [Abortiporus biennis]